MLLELEKWSVCCCYLWRRDDAFSPRDGEHVRICLRSCHQQCSGSGSSQAGLWAPALGLEKLEEQLPDHTPSSTGHGLLSRLGSSGKQPMEVLWEVIQ